MLPQVLIIIPQAEENYLFPQAMFFLTIYHPAESGGKETVNTPPLFLFPNVYKLTFQFIIFFSLPLIPLYLLCM